MIETEVELMTMRRPTEATLSESNYLLPGTNEVPPMESSYSKYKLIGGVLLSAFLIAVGVNGMAPRDVASSGEFHDLEGSNLEDQEIEVSLELEGKKKTDCEDGKYSKRTLQLAYELPFMALFPHNKTKGRQKYEASSVTIQNGQAYAVCDASWSISKFGLQLQPFAEENVEIGDPHRQDDDSDFEAIFADDDFFYVVRESIKQADETYHAVIQKLAVDADQYEVIESCPSEFQFEGDSKGFEGAVNIYDLNNEMVVLGLCEGNYCSEKKKNQAGNGRIVAMRKEINLDGTCTYKTIRKIHIPKSVEFLDYSAMTIDSKGRVAITSQENSQMWVGRMLGMNDEGLYDVDVMEFDEDVGKVYDFPKNDACEIQYCNIEGVHWLNEEMVIAVSDKMKGHGKQSFHCFEKDQSVHVFVLPQ